MLQLTQCERIEINVLKIGKATKKKSGYVCRASQSSNDLFIAAACSFTSTAGQPSGSKTEGIV